MIKNLLIIIFTFVFLGTSAEEFSFKSAGDLLSNSGSGLRDSTVYAPNIRFPLESPNAYLNSQVYNPGGSISGSQCSSSNYSYPWRDTFCETRSGTAVLCPSGKGHQGVDIRPSTCRNNKHWVVSVVSGSISYIGSFSVTVLAEDGTQYRYLHMDSIQVARGDSVSKGTRLGKVSNVTSGGGHQTTYHLHFEVRKNINNRLTFMPPYMSLVKSYQRLLKGFDIATGYFSSHSDICDSCSNNFLDVRNLQVLLNASQHTDLVVDGIWGGKTKAEVINFQRIHGLTETGRVDSNQIKNKLDSVLAELKGLSSDVLPKPYVYPPSFSSEIYLGDEINISVKVKNEGGVSDDGRITISFPNITHQGDANLVSSLVSGARIYAKGDSIKSKDGSNIQAKYLMVEYKDPNWKKDEIHTLSFKLRLLNKGSHKINVRSTMHIEGKSQNSSNYINSPSEIIFKTDQQGFLIKEYAFDVLDNSQRSADLRIRPQDITIRSRPDNGSIINTGGLFDIKVNVFNAGEADSSDYGIKYYYSGLSSTFTSFDTDADDGINSKEWGGFEYSDDRTTVNENGVHRVKVCLINLDNNDNVENNCAIKSFIVGGLYDEDNYKYFSQNEILLFNSDRKKKIYLYSQVVFPLSQVEVGYLMADSTRTLTDYQKVEDMVALMEKAGGVIDGISILNSKVEDEAAEYIRDQSIDFLLDRNLTDPKVALFLEKFNDTFVGGVECAILKEKSACIEAAAIGVDLTARGLSDSEINNNNKKVNAIYMALASVRNSIRENKKLNLDTASIDAEIDKINDQEEDIYLIDTSTLTSLFNIFSEDFDRATARKYIKKFQNSIFDIDYSGLQITVNYPPSKPQLTLDGDVYNASLTPTLKASGFSDTDTNDSHYKTWWGIREHGKKRYIFDSGWKTNNKYSINIPASANLKRGVKYQAVVAFMDNRESFSNARFITFTTKADTNPNNKPNTPSVEVNGGVNDVSLTPVLTTSSFSDLDAKDSHDATWWEIRKTGSVIWNSSWDKTNLTSITIPTGILDLETTYTIYVRYRDSRSAISGLGSVTFTTKSAIGTDNKPDLAVINVSVSNTSPIVGESIQLEADIKNIGSATATGAYTRYYVSTDSNITTSDTEVDSETTSSLDANETDSERETFSAPVASGTYWVGMCVDVVTNESDTSNNCSSGLKIIVSESSNGNSPDLIILNPSVSSNSLNPSESFTINYSVKNIGDGGSNVSDTRIRFYKSTDTIIDTSDTDIGTNTADSLSPNQVKSFTRTLQAPSNAGTYWIGACVRLTSSESNISNNCSEGVKVVVATDEIEHDFLISSFSVSENQLKLNDRYDIDVTFDYQGSSSLILKPKARIYISKDTNVDVSDKVFFEIFGGIELSDTSTSVSKLYKTRSYVDVPSGSYYLIMKIDDPEKYSETDEANNTKAVPITIIDDSSGSFNLDIDGDGEVKPLTDGLLNLRYQFGFRGDTLINSAISPSATRKTADEIETYLIEGGLSLDIDGDGEIKPLTDGLLVLRYSFGFRDDTLINNAIDVNATRKTSGDIETFLQSIVR